MARCQECKNDFDVTAEEQRLIITKKMEELCMACAMKKYQSKEVEFVATAPMVPRPGSIPVGPKRVNWISSNGDLRAFMSIPPPKLYSAQMLYNLHKPGRLHAFVFMPAPTRMPSEPTLLIHTNIDRFRSRNENFWVKKVPEFYDPFTGVGNITIPFNQVTKVELSPEEKVVHVDDGSCVKVHYVW